LSVRNGRRVSGASRRFASRSVGRGQGASRDVRAQRAVTRSAELTPRRDGQRVAASDNWSYVKRAASGSQIGGPSRRSGYYISPNYRMQSRNTAFAERPDVTTNEACRQRSPTERCVRSNELRGRSGDIRGTDQGTPNVRHTLRASRSYAMRTIWPRTLFARTWKASISGR